MSSKPRPSGEQPATGFAKRVLVVDPDQKAWEVGARLLIAQGCLVHRISHLAEAPAALAAAPLRPGVVAAEDPPSPEVVEFCQKLAQLQPPVRVALLASGSASVNPSVAPVIRRDRPAAEIAEGIVRLLR